MNEQPNSAPDIETESGTESLVQQKNREELIQKFDDNQTPTGEDFEALIRSGINQMDDPIRVNEDGTNTEVEITSPLVIKNAEGATRITPDSLNIDDEFLVDSHGVQAFGVVGIRDASDPDAQLQVLGKTQLAGDLKVTGDAQIEQSVEVGETITTRNLVVSHGNQKVITTAIDTEQGSTIQADANTQFNKGIEVTEGIKTDTFNVSDSAVLAGQTSTENLEVNDTANFKGPIAAKNAIFEAHVEAADSLGIGVNEDRTAAKLHINKRRSDTQALFRADDENNDNTPFIINAEGKVGVGFSDPQVALHVGGDVQIGTESPNIAFSESGEAFVRNKLGLGKENPTSTLDIAGGVAVGNSSKTVDDGSLFVENKLGIGTESPSKTLDVKGDVAITDGVGDETGTLTVANRIGVGTINPVKSLDVTGDVAIRASEPGSEGNLTVANKLGIGTDEPEAKVAIKTSVGSALKVKSDVGKEVLDVSVGTDSVSGSTLTVNAESKLNANVTVQPGKRLGVGTDNPSHELDVRGSAAFSQADTQKVNLNDGEVFISNKLGVGNNAPKNALDVNGGVLIGDGQETLSADVGLSVKHKVGLGIAEPQARLHVKGEAGELLKVSQNEQALLNVNPGQVDISVPTYVQQQLTAESAVVDTHLMAKTADVTDSLTSGPATMSSATVQSQVKAQSIVITQDPEDHLDAVVARLSVESDMGNQRGVSIDYSHMGKRKPVFNTKAEWVGVLCDTPMEIPQLSMFEVGSASVFGDSIEVKDVLTITRESEGKTTSLAAFEDNAIQFGQLNAPTLLTGYGAQQWFGAVSLGSLDDANSQLTIYKDMGDALVIQNSDSSQFTKLASGTLSINGMVMDEQIFMLNGSGTIKGTLSLLGRLEHMGDYMLTGNLNQLGDLDVTGMVAVNGDMKVTGRQNIQNGLSISITTNSAEESSSPSYALSVAGNSLLNGGLSVAGDGLVKGSFTVEQASHLQGFLTVDAHTQLNDSLAVQGMLTANQNVRIAGSGDGDALSVEQNAGFSADVSVDGIINMTNRTGRARLHISDDQLGKSAFRVENSDESAALVFGQGRLGLGLEQPQYMLDVAEDSKFRKDLSVSGRVEVDDSLHVNEYATLRSNLNVYGMSELFGETRVGFDFHNTEDSDAKANPNAQLSLEQNHFDKAFAVYTKGEQPVVIQDGNVGIGTEKPKQRLHVEGDSLFKGDLEISGAIKGSGRLECWDGAKIFGDVELRSDLTVNDDVLLKDTLTVEGASTLNHSLKVSGAADFASPVGVVSTLTVDKLTHLRDQLIVGQGATIYGSLTVESIQPDNQVVFKPYTHLQGGLKVSGQSTFNEDVDIQSGLMVSREIQVGDTKYAKAKISVDVAAGDNALVIGSAGETKLTISSDGNLGIGTDIPEEKLVVAGNAKVSGMLDVADKLLATSGAQITGDVALLGKVSIDNELLVAANTKISGELIADGGAQVMGTLKTDKLECNGELVAEQLIFAESPMISAVSKDVALGGKSASDNVLATQAAVKAYVDNHAWDIGQGRKTYVVNNQKEFDAVFSQGKLVNSTVLLFPHNSRREVTKAYRLMEPVEIGSNVSIIGFNAAETRIVKAHPGCRFLFNGERDVKVTNVNMEGFTFDGLVPEKSLEQSVFEGNGGAFSLRHVKDIKLNCIIENHGVSGDGGAIYSERTAMNVEAKHIRRCHAQRQGGGAFGLSYSFVHAEQCKAERGGAVARCDDCQVQASENVASRSGGGAYKCRNLVCEGHWRNNNSAADGANHILAKDNNSKDKGRDNEEYLWYSVYLDRPLTKHTHPWQSYNI